VKIKLYRELYDREPGAFEPIVGKLFEHAWRHDKFCEVDISRYAKKKCQELIALATKHASAYGTKVMIQDINAWIKIVESKGRTGKPRNIQQFASIAMEMIRNAPGHRLYFRDESRGIELVYYVSRVLYHPPKTHRSDSYSEPAHCEIQVLYYEFKELHTASINFYAEHALRTHPEKAFANKGYFLETPELRERYLAHQDRFDAYHHQVGFQMLAEGIATDDMDGNKKSRDSWYWSRTNNIRLDHDGTPARVVIDVFQEDDKEERRGRKPHWDPFFWKKRKPETADKYDDEEIEDDGDEEPDIEIPHHPFVACFDMRRHLRLRIHIGQLKAYKYDPKLGDKLVLPSEVTDLVQVLIQHKDVFVDVVKGKGGGAIILCAGPPGTGKTLTAEVYAEVMGLPLYSVQASQLGVDPEDLEDSLLKCFARASRWNAILLLDEADVYVAKRGDDLTQNAIVGVFLRVLEYYGGVLFFTTNRADSVDDAIASRCVARIDYQTPSPLDQARIWRIIADSAGVGLPGETIVEAVKRHPGLSGRDIKNLIKLAHMVSVSRGEPITPDTIDFVKRFKPTSDVGDLSLVENALDKLLEAASTMRG